MTPIFRNHLRTGLAGVALLAAGITGGAVVARSFAPTVEMAPMRATPIRSLTAGDSVVTVKGRVAEVFGNKFVLDDGSGHALVDTGPKGDDAGLVAAGAPVTVQGRFDRGMMHASFLVDASGKVVALAPLAPPPHGLGGPDGPGGPGGPGAGPRDRNAPPPPPGAPAPAPVTAAPAPAPATAG